MNKRIRLIGFRNGLYAGQLKQNSKSVQNPEGIGILIDDMFLTCLSSWGSDQSGSASKPKGPTILFYPHRQILYTQSYPKNSKLTGFWCYIVPQFKIFGYGQNQHLAILHKSGRIISKTRIINGKQLQSIQDNPYQNQQQKWKKIEQIIGSKISSQNRSLKQFINYYFVNELKNEQLDNFVYMRIKGSQQLYGIVAGHQGLAFSLRDQTIMSTGHYKNLDTNKVMSYGRLYKDQVNSTSYKIQQGNFQSQDIFSFQFNEKRPQESYKQSRNYFRQSTVFYNQFIQLQDADQIYKKLQKLSKQYLINIGSKYGQRIIQGSQREPRTRQEIMKRYQTQQNQDKKYEPITSRQYNLLQAKQAIESEIQKKKFSSDRSKTGFRSDGLSDQASTYRKNTYKSPLRYQKFSSKQNNRQLSSDRSPIKSSPRKYKYHLEEIDSIRNDETFANIPRRIQVNSIKQFALYPNTVIERQRRDLQRIEKQVEQQRIQRQRLFRLAQYERQKHDEQQIRLLKQLEKQNQLQKQLFLQRILVLQKLPTFGQNQYNKNSLPQNFHNRHVEKFDNMHKRAEILNMSPNDAIFRRKYVNNYKYVEQRDREQKDGQKKFQLTNITRRNKLIENLSPVNKLYTQQEHEKGQPLTSKSPLGNRKTLATTARRTYTYLE